MKQKHMMVIGALTICGGLLVAVPSSFAVKSMDDSDMDGITAAGQSRIDVGDGNQYIGDGSLYSVSLNGGQADVTGGSIVNIAGENNIAVGVNVVNSDAADSLSQNNNITQQRNAQLVIYGSAQESGADGSTGGGATGPGLVWGVSTPSSVVNANTYADGTVDTTVIGGADMTVDNINASADHIKIGQGNQTEVDSSDYSVEIDATSQQLVTALSLVNAAGRNNIAIGINAANSDQLIGVSGSVNGLAANSLTTIIQANTFIQQN